MIALEAIVAEMRAQVARVEAAVQDLAVALSRASRVLEEVP